MRAVVQRVSRASVRIDDRINGSIEHGLLVYLGVTTDDGDEDLDWLMPKIVNLRVFEDDDGRMNKSVKDVEGGILLISQFTLYGNLRKGTRPSFNDAAHPDIAVPIYESAIKRLSLELGQEIATGEFGAMMEVDAINHGPVTIIIDSKNKKF